MALYLFSMSTGNSTTTSTSTASTTIAQFLTLGVGLDGEELRDLFFSITSEEERAKITSDNVLARAQANKVLGLLQTQFPALPKPGPSHGKAINIIKKLFDDPERLTNLTPLVTSDSSADTTSSQPTVPSSTTANIVQPTILRTPEPSMHGGHVGASPFLIDLTNDQHDVQVDSQASMNKWLAMNSPAHNAPCLGSLLETYHLPAGHCVAPSWRTLIMTVYGGNMVTWVHRFPWRIGAQNGGEGVHKYEALTLAYIADTLCRELGSDHFYSLATAEIIYRRIAALQCVELGNPWNRATLLELAPHGILPLPSALRGELRQESKHRDEMERRALRKKGAAVKPTAAEGQ